MSMKNSTRKLLGLSLFLINAFLCIVTIDLDFVVELLGSTTMPFIAYVIPGALYYMYIKSEESTEKQLWKKLGCLALMSIGLIFIACYITISINDFFEPNNE